MRLTFPPCSESCRNWVSIIWNQVTKFLLNLKASKRACLGRLHPRTCRISFSTFQHALLQNLIHLKTLGSEFLAPVLSDMPEPDEGTKIRGMERVKIERNQNRWNLAPNVVVVSFEFSLNLSQLVASSLGKDIASTRLLRASFWLSGWPATDWALNSPEVLNSTLTNNLAAFRIR